MGNWRTVQVQGTIDIAEAQEAIGLLHYRLTGPGFIPAFTCLSWTDPVGLMGLGQWIFPDGRVEGHGNLAERDYSLDAVKSTLRHLALLFPSLHMALHAGGENEDPTCVATFWVRDRQVMRLEPQVPEVQGRSYGEMLTALLRNLGRPHLSPREGV